MKSPPKRALCGPGRSLNASQRMLIAAGFLKWEREQAKMRQREHGGTAPGKTLMRNSAGVSTDAGSARAKAGCRGPLPWIGYQRARCQDTKHLKNSHSARQRHGGQQYS